MSPVRDAPRCPSLSVLLSRDWSVKTRLVLFLHWGKRHSPNLYGTAMLVLDQGPFGAGNPFHVPDDLLKKRLFNMGGSSEGLHACGSRRCASDREYIHEILNMAKDREESLRHTNFPLIFRAKRLTAGYTRDEGVA
jgi:hypothetical protein